MLKDKFIKEEIWKLKNKDKPKVKDNAVPPNLIDSPIDQRNLKDEKPRGKSTKKRGRVSKATVPKSKILRKFRGNKDFNQAGGKG